MQKLRAVEFVSLLRFVQNCLVGALGYITPFARMSCVACTACCNMCLTPCMRCAVNNAGKCDGLHGPPSTHVFS